MSEKAAELNSQIAQHITRLAQLTDAARISAEMQTFLATCAKFYHYSPGNQDLIHFQNPGASMVAGFHAWHKFNRYVRKGEHGIAILAPCSWKIENEAGETVGQRLGGFRVAYVFDVSQTDGEPLPPTPNWQSPTKSSVLYERLYALATAEGYKVTVEECAGDMQGWTDGGRIVLAPGAGTKTLIHELAHCVLKHPGDITRTREEKETQAEAVAYVVATALQLDAPGSPNYLALWNADSSKIMASLRTIQTAAAKIITAVELLQLETEGA